MIELLGYRILKKPLKTINFSEVKVISTINPHSYCVSKQDTVFARALKSSDLLLPDGIGIVWAERMLNVNSIKRISGYDLFLYLMRRANASGQKVFFLGATENTLQNIKKNAALDFPKVQVYSYSPAYKAKFSTAESSDMCAEIDKVQPDILFVGMTAPKQEKWVYEFKDLLDVSCICSIGAVFDFYAGNIRRPSDFWIKLGLEWLPRLLREPRRLFYRNFVSTPKFILQVLSIKIFGKGIL